MLANTDGDERENIRWIWGLKAVDELLNCFCLPVQDKLSLLQNLRTAFGNEFNVDKPCRTQLNNKYRSNSAMITMVMTSGSALPTKWQHLIKILEERSDHIRPITARIGSWFNTGSDRGFFFSLLGSYIHMMLNRIIAAEPRAHELVIYDFLVRYYKTQMARADFVYRID
jgi:thiopeptide-type bacteriocin biosynthesis protein